MGPIATCVYIDLQSIVQLPEHSFFLFTALQGSQAAIEKPVVAEQNKSAATSDTDESTAV